MGKAVAKAVIRADNRKLSGDLRKSRSMFGKAFKGIGRGIKGSLSTVLSPLGAAAGALGFAAIGKEVLEFEQTLTDIRIQGDASGATMGELRDTIDKLSRSNAEGRDSLSALALEMVNLEGKAGLNAEKLGVLADAAFATSAPVAELAGLSLALGNAFGLADPTKLKQGLDGIITAGKEGSIPLAEMNLLLQQNGAQFSKFAGQGVAAASSMAATLQGLRKDFGSAGEAGTALGSIMGIFQVRELQLRKAGIEVKKSNGDFRELADIVSDINLSGLVNNAKKFNKAFGTRKEARLALDSLIKRKSLIEDITRATVDSNAIDLDGAKRRTSESFRIKKAFNDLKLLVADAFTPARIQKFASAMEGLATVIGFIADNIDSFIIALVTFKISRLVGGFQSMAASSSAMSASSAATAGSMGGIASSAALAGAAFAGWQLGKALDQALGISDAISNLALPSAQEKKHFGTGALRGAAETFERERGFAQEKAPGKGSKFNIGRAFNRAQRIAEDARRLGLVGEGGKVDRAKVFKAQTGKTILGGVEGPKFAKLEERTGSADLLRTIEQALQITAVGKKAEAQGLNITITVDENGLLKAKAIEKRNARRAPQ